MEIGDIILRDGLKLEVIGFTEIYGQKYPNTKVIGEMDINASKAPPQARAVHTCQYCGREIRGKVGLMKHEEFCSKNPDRKEKAK